MGIDSFLLFLLKERKIEMNGITMMVIAILFLGAGYVFYGNGLLRRGGSILKSLLLRIRKKMVLIMCQRIRMLYLVINLPRSLEQDRSMVRSKLRFLAGCQFYCGSFLAACSLVRFKILPACTLH